MKIAVSLLTAWCLWLTFLVFEVHEEQVPLIMSTVSPPTQPLEIVAPPQIQFFDDRGSVLAGGLVYTYKATTSIPWTTYRDRCGQMPNMNPIMLNSAGRATIFVEPGTHYRFVVKKNWRGRVIWSQDDIGPTGWAFIETCVN